MLSATRLAASGLVLLAFVRVTVLPAAGADTLADKAKAVLNTHCAACHGKPGSAKGGFDYVLDRDRLVTREQVVPGKADESPLLLRVRKGEMPPAQRPAPTAEEVESLRRWIEAGAPVFRTAPASRPLTTESDVVRAVLADLQNLEPRRQRFVRYLSLSHLSNAGMSDEELAAHRHAVAKLVNGLSWHPRVTGPQAVDAAGTLLRLDLRDYKWTARQWDHLAAVYPYRAAEEGETAKAVATLTGAARSHLRADWFVATASRPTFYQDFLQLPTSDRALERLLQVDVAADVQDDRVIRAGFNGSGVSRNNRVLQRHDAAYGAYWRSYDFSDNTGRQNVFEYPLGPFPGPRAFIPAGGEVIFSLPNGLHAYMLVDGNGRRVDKAPGDIVNDPKRPDKLVETGISCMSCHFGGLLPKDDQVRPHVLKNADAFTKEDRETVLALYPPSTRFRAAMNDDIDRFAQALKKAGVPAGEPEPVSTVTLRYEGTLDLATAAGETGTTPDDFAARLRKAPALGRTLGALLTRGGSVQRQVFEDVYPELARAFRIGTDAGTAAAAVSVEDAYSGHRGAVRGLAFAPDGKTFVSCGEDQTLRLWDVATGKEAQRFAGHNDEVTDAVFTPDGRHLVSAGRDRSVRLWDAATGKEECRFTGHTDVVRCVAVSPDGKQILSGGADRTVRLWDLASGNELSSLPGHTGTVTAVAFSPDGKLALSAGQDRTLRLWDVEGRRSRGLWEGHTGEVYSVAFSANGTRAVSGGNDKTVRLWDVTTGKQRKALTGHANAVVRVAFSPDGCRVFSGSSRYQTADRVVRVWDVESGKEVGGFDGTGLERVESIAFDAAGVRAVLSHSGGALRLWAMK
jgi:mono/diheme cytochrome c family protein